MMLRAGAAPAVALALVVVTGCHAATPPPPAPEGDQPPLPTSWTLLVSVAPSAGIHVTGSRVSAWEHAISLAVDAGHDRPADHCSVDVSLTGHGGADRWVGEQVPTTVRGRPALRNGAGAEGPYLTWQDAEGRWLAVQCESEATMPVVADRVRSDRTSTLTVPFGLTVPQGYAVSSVDVAHDPVAVRVSIDRLDRAYAEALDVSVRPVATYGEPTGAPTTVGGRAGLRSDDPRFPSVCVGARATPPAYVCVGIPPDDTGPYPDRADDLPVIEALAGSLRFAELDDPTTWFDADRALR